MGFWSRMFGPRRAVVADPKALGPHTIEASPRVELRDTGYRPPVNEQLTDPRSALWRTYPEDGITPEAYRGMQRLADLGHVSRLMELYDAMANDYQVGSQLRTRKLSVAGAPITFESGDGSKGGQKIADAFAKMWSDIPDETQLRADILDDFYRGFSLVRPIWDSVDGKWPIVGHEAIESRYLYFENGTRPLITRMPGLVEGVPIPDGYVYSECRDKAGPAVRGGAGRSVGKLWIAKGYGLVDCQAFLEKHGTPHVQVTTARELREGDPLLQRVKDAARAFITDNIGIMPAGFTLQMLEAVNAAGTVRDVYIVFFEFCDKGIAVTISGQPSSSGFGPAGLGHGGESEQHAEVRQDLKEADARRTECRIRNSIARPWTLYHFGPNSPVPQVCIDVKQPEDQVQATLSQKQRAEALNILRAMGMRIPMKQQYTDFNIEPPDDLDEDAEFPVAAPDGTTNTGDPSKGVPDATTPAPDAAQGGG